MVYLRQRGPGQHALVRVVRAKIACADAEVTEQDQGDADAKRGE